MYIGVACSLGILQQLAKFKCTVIMNPQADAAIALHACGAFQGLMFEHYFCAHQLGLPQLLQLQQHISDALMCCCSWKSCGNPQSCAQNGSSSWLPEHALSSWHFACCLHALVFKCA